MVANLGQTEMPPTVAMGIPNPDPSGRDACTTTLPVFRRGYGVTGLADEACTGPVARTCTGPVARTCTGPVLVTPGLTCTLKRVPVPSSMYRSRRRNLYIEEGTGTLANVQLTKKIKTTGMKDFL